MPSTLSTVLAAPIRSWLAIFSLLAGAILCPAPIVAQSSNVLVIIADDLGVDHVGAYAEGSSIAPTPNIDALAQRGVLFRNAWASPTCSPTRACLHTGRYGYRTGVGSPGQNAVLAAEELTLPDRLDLAGSGYAHALLGKWHLGGDLLGPNLAGWSHFAGFLNANVANYFFWDRVENGQPRTSQVYQTTQTTDDALQWIQLQNGPWVCVVAYGAPHSPFHQPPANLHTRTLPAVPPRQNPLPFYQAAIEAMDSEIGRLLATLGPELQNTDVIFFGDNGTPGNVSVAPFTAAHAKSTPYEGGVNVPLIVAGPSVQAPGREVTGLVHAVDLNVTVLELAGVDPQGGFGLVDGVSILPQLASAGAPPQRDVVYAESFNRTRRDDTGFACARDGQFKLIRFFEAAGVTRDEFYDLTADPFEANDLLLAGLSAAEQARFDALLAHIEAVRDLDGSFTTFGSTQCTGSNGAPAMSCPDLPGLGTSYRVDLRSGPSNAPCVLFVGESATQWLGLPLPFDLALVGAGPGCLVHSSNEVQLSRVTDPNGDASVTIAIPNIPALASGSIYHNWLCIDIAAPGNPLGVTASSGGHARIGG